MWKGPVAGRVSCYRAHRAHTGERKEIMAEIRSDIVTLSPRDVTWRVPVSRASRSAEITAPGRDIRRFHTKAALKLLSNDPSVRNYSWSRLQISWAAEPSQMWDIFHLPPESRLNAVFRCVAGEATRCNNNNYAQFAAWPLVTINILICSVQS